LAAVKGIFRIFMLTFGAFYSHFFPSKNNTELISLSENRVNWMLTKCR
jgi:hypothetical protein